MLHQHPGALTLTKQVIDYCAFKPGAKVLDVGCGTGATVEYLCDVRRLNASGVDISEARLEQAWKRAPGLQFIQASGESLPFADDFFDGVVAECSLSVMHDVDAVLAEINRILIPGGKLAITDVYILDTDGLADSWNNNKLSKRLNENGFSVIIWEDQSAFLREFVASYIMEYGSMEGLWQCRPNPKTKMGYFLLVAEKMANERMSCFG